MSVWRLNYQISHWGLNWKDPKVQIWHQQVKISLCLLAAGLLTKREKAVYSFQMHHCIHSGRVQYGGRGCFAFGTKYFHFSFAQSIARCIFIFIECTEHCISELVIFVQRVGRCCATEDLRLIVIFFHYADATLLQYLKCKHFLQVRAIYFLQLLYFTI